MSFTFTNNPADIDRDAIRVLINDMTETSNSLTDEILDWLLDTHSHLYYAAAAACDTLAVTYAAAASEKQVGDLKLKAGGGDPVKRYRDLADRYRQQAAVKGFKAYSGGISIADKDTELQDSDRPVDEAAIGMHDNLSVTGSTSGRWDF